MAGNYVSLIYRDYRAETERSSAAPGRMLAITTLTRRQLIATAAGASLAALAVQSILTAQEPTNINIVFATYIRSRCC